MDYKVKITIFYFNIQYGKYTKISKLGREICQVNVQSKKKSRGGTKYTYMLEYKLEIKQQEFF